MLIQWRNSLQCLAVRLGKRGKYSREAFIQTGSLGWHNSLLQKRLKDIQVNSSKNLFERTLHLSWCKEPSQNTINFPKQYFWRLFDPFQFDFLPAFRLFFSAVSFITGALAQATWNSQWTDRPSRFCWTGEPPKLGQHLIKCERTIGHWQPWIISIFCGIFIKMTWNTYLCIASWTLIRIDKNHMDFNDDCETQPYMSHGITTLSYPTILVHGDSHAGQFQSDYKINQPHATGPFRGYKHVS